MTNFPEILKLAQSLILPTLFGYVLLCSILKSYKLPMPFMLALSFGLGLGIITSWMLYLGICKIPLTYPNLSFPLTAGFIFLFIRQIKNQSKLHRSDLLPINGLTGPSSFARYTILYILLIPILLSVHFVMIAATQIPIFTWDAIATVAFKAKIIFHEQSLPQLNLLPHPTYPLFVPLAEVWVAMNIGYWSDTLIKIIFPTAFINYLLIHYYCVRSLSNTSWAVVSCFLLCSSNLFLFHGTIGYRDFFLMYFNCSVILLLLLWKNFSAKPLLLIASLLAGVGTLVKLEGSMYLIIYCLVLSLILYQKKEITLKEKIKQFMKFTLPASLMGLSFHAYKWFLNVTLEGPGSIDKTGLDVSWAKLLLLPRVILSFWENFTYTNNWGLLWVAGFLSLLHWKEKKDDQNIPILTVALALFFAFYIAVALLTTNYTWIAGAHKATTNSRLILHFFPLITVLFVLLSKRDA